MKKQYIQRLLAAFVIFWVMLSNLQAQNINGTSEVCVGGKADYSLVIPVANGWVITSYNWTVLEGLPVINSTAATYSVNYTNGRSDGGPARVRLIYTWEKTTNGVKTFGTGTLYASTNVIGTLAPTVTVAADNYTICQNGFTRVYATVGPGNTGARYTYLWSNSAVSSPNSIITVTGAGTYSVVAINQCNNNYPSSNSAAIRAVAPPATDISGVPAGSVCPGTFINLVASGANTYLWSATADMNASTASIVTVRPLVTTTYTVSGSNGICAVSKSVTINVYPISNVQVPDAEILVCGNPATFTLTPSGAANYTYSPATGLNAATGSSVTGILSPANSPMTYTISGTNNDGCANTGSSKIVKVYAGVPKAETIYGFADNINGPVSPAYLCVNPVDQNYRISTSANPVSKTNYNWYFTQPGSVDLINNIGNGLITVNAHFWAGFTGTKTLEVNATNACGSAVIASFDNIISPMTTAAALDKPTGPEPVKSTDLSIYQATVVTGVKEWEILPASAFVSYRILPNDRVEIDWNDAFGGSATIRVRNTNNCVVTNWSDYARVTVCGPSNTLDVTGPSLVDNSENTIFQTKLVAGTKFWNILPANAVVSMSVLPNERLSVNWNPAFTGNATVSVQCNGYCSSTPKTIAVTSGQCDKWESNNTLATARSITTADLVQNPDNRTSAVIADAADIDWFSFYNTSSTPNIQITLSNLATDFDVELYNSAGTRIGISQNGSNISEKINFNTLTVGQYYIRVYGYLGKNSTQCYYLSAKLSNGQFARMADDITVEEKVEPGELFSVYPNPTEAGTDVLLVIPSGGENTTESVVITDMNGKAVYETNAQFAAGSSRINIANLNSGIYLIDIKGLGKKKLVVQ